MLVINQEWHEMLLKSQILILLFFSYNLTMI